MQLNPLLLIFWLSIYGLSVTPLHAEIITDGTAGSAQILTGPNFTIPENLGTRAGDNLFHSFEQFNIATGEQATFTGSPTITNVISRVTGGDASTINGLLRSEVGQADFYFINPAGVVFGAGAQVDVPASFYVSTADELRFADDTLYSTTHLQASTWSVDAPKSFGFLGNQIASISVIESKLVLNPGNKTLAMSAGELDIKNAQLEARGGKIQLTATGDIPMISNISGELSDAAQGQLSINKSLLISNVFGYNGGEIILHGGSTLIDSSELSVSGLFSNPSINHDIDNYGIDIHSQSLEIIDSIFTAGKHR